MQEYEIKFLEVDVPSLEKKLLEIGAEKVGEYEYTRANFDYPNQNLGSKHGWIRLRTDGKETTLAYKENLKKKLEDGSVENVGAKEIEILVDDFEKTFELLKVIGLVAEVEEKNRRLRYIKGDVIFDIDSWPFIPTYLEIESISFEKVKNAARELGLDLDSGVIGSAGSIYKKYGFNFKDYSSITFEGMIKK